MKTKKSDRKTKTNKKGKLAAKPPAPAPIKTDMSKTNDDIVNLAHLFKSCQLIKMAKCSGHVSAGHACDILAKRITQIKDTLNDLLAQAELI